MKFRDIKIDGFGVWSDLRLADLVDDINVFYGPNEAGKSTLLQFLRTMLYGFTPDRQSRYLPPVHGGRPGGEVAVRAADVPYTIRRHHAAPESASLGRVEIVTSEEVIHDERLLTRLLGHVDEPVYRNVFAIGLREIQELGSLTDTDAAQWLYKLAAAGDRVSLVDVLGELTKARERLLSSGAAPSTIAQLAAERDRLRRETHQQAAVHKYIELGQKRRELAADIEKWEAESVAAERSARLVEIAAAMFEKWHERARLDERLAAARSVPRLAEQTLADFEALTEKISRGRRRAKLLARRREETAQAIDSLGLNDAIWRRATRIEAILEQEQWITALDAERVALLEQVAGLEAKRAELCTRLGFDPAQLASMPGDGDAKAWRLLKPLAKALRESREQLNAATAEVEAKQGSADAASQELAKSLKARGADKLTPLLERSGQLVSQLRRRVQLGDLLSDLSDRKAELEARSGELAAHALLPGWVVVVLGIVFVIGIMAFLAGLILPASWVGWARLTLLFAGLVTSGASAATKIVLEKSFERRSNTCLAQLETVTSQINQAAAERDALDQQLPTGGGPLLTRLQAAEKELAAIEALVPLESQRQSGAQQLQAAEDRREQSHQDYIQKRHRWRSALEQAGLAHNTPPAQARQMARIRKSVGRFDTRLATEREELTRRQNVVVAFYNRLLQLRAELAAPVAADADTATAIPTAKVVPVVKPTDAKVPDGKLSERLVEELRWLREQLREQTALASRRRTLIKRSRVLRERRVRVRQVVKRIERRGLALLEREGVAHATELRYRAQQNALADQLAIEQNTLADEIDALVGPLFHESDAADLVTRYSRPQLDERWLELSGRARELREKVKAGHEQLGRWDQETQTLLAERRPGHARLQLAAIEQQLHDAIGRWRVLATTQWLLAGVRKRYERERQPETLREASGYLERLTDGRYRRVWTPLDLDVLRVEDAQGHTLPVEVLSRGTREQLFLSLRLALVSWYSRRGIELPVILDDVLVNFDAQRTTLAAEMLRDFARRGHQLLVFTCHEHIYRLFRSLGVSARELPANPSLPARPRVIVAEQELPPAPVLPPPAPVMPRPQAIEIVEPAPAPTNGHKVEHAEVVEPPPPPPPPPPRSPVAVPVMVRPERRATVKFDHIHGPRGPFATALWHDRVTYELSEEADEVVDVETIDDSWTEIDGTD